MSTNMSLGENFISFILMLVLSLSVTVCLRASLECLPAWNSSPVPAESFPLLQSVFQACFSVQPITDILLYLVSYMEIKCIVL